MRASIDLRAGGNHRLSFSYIKVPPTPTEGGAARSEATSSTTKVVLDESSKAAAKDEGASQAAIFTDYLELQSNMQRVTERIAAQKAEEIRQLEVQVDAMQAKQAAKAAAAAQAERDRLQEEQRVINAKILARGGGMELLFEANRDSPQGSAIEASAQVGSEGGMELLFGPNEGAAYGRAEVVNAGAGPESGMELLFRPNECATHGHAAEPTAGAALEGGVELSFDASWAAEASTEASRLVQAAIAATVSQACTESMAAATKIVEAAIVGGTAKAMRHWATATLAEEVAGEVTGKLAAEVAEEAADEVRLTAGKAFTAAKVAVHVQRRARGMLARRLAREKAAARAAAKAKKEAEKAVKAAMKAAVARDQKLAATFFDKAAARMQARVRGMKERRLVAEKAAAKEAKEAAKKAAIVAKEEAKAELARRIAAEQTKAATRMQARSRGAKGRETARIARKDKETHQHRAATHMQARSRGTKGREVAQTIRENKATQERAESTAAMQLTSLARGYLGRADTRKAQRELDLEDESKSLAERRHQMEREAKWRIAEARITQHAILMMQSLFRKRRDRLHFEARRAESRSANTLQTQWRGHRSRRSASEYSEQRTSAATVLQSRARARLARHDVARKTVERGAAQRNAEEENEAAVVVQAAVRRSSSRREMLARRARRMLEEDEAVEKAAKKATKQATERQAAEAASKVDEAAGKGAASVPATMTALERLRADWDDMSPVNPKAHLLDIDREPTSTVALSPHGVRTRKMQAQAPSTAWMSVSTASPRPSTASPRSARRRPEWDSGPWVRPGSALVELGSGRRLAGRRAERAASPSSQHEGSVHHRMPDILDTRAVPAPVKAHALRVPVTEQVVLVPMHRGQHRVLVPQVRQTVSASRLRSTTVYLESTGSASTPKLLEKFEGGVLAPPPRPSSLGSLPTVHESRRGRATSHISLVMSLRLEEDAQRKRMLAKASRSLQNLNVVARQRPHGRLLASLLSG